MSTCCFDIDQELEHLDPSLSSLNSISSDILQAALPTNIEPRHPNLTQIFRNDHCDEPSTSNQNNTDSIPYANALKNPRSITPDSLPHTTNIFAVALPKKRYDIMQDPVS